jgi:lambda family phage portal protein
MARKRKRSIIETAAATALAVEGRPQPGAMMAWGFGSGATGASRMARSDRFANWRPTVADADGYAQQELGDLRAFSRDLERTAPIATSAIETKTSYVIGSGLTLQSRIDTEELGLSSEAASDWQRKTERRFNVWASDLRCSTNRRQDFYDLQDMAYRGRLVSGDSFVLLASRERPGWPFSLALQVIEADRICNEKNVVNTAKLVDGIEYDEATGEPVRAYVSAHHPGRILPGKDQSWTKVPFYGKSGRCNLIQVSRILRPGQTRGIPDLGPIIATIKQLDRYSNAEVDAAVNSAALALFTTMDAEAFREIFSDEGDQSAYIQKAADWDGSIDSGKSINLFPGESISSPTPGRPNPNYDPFFNSFLSLVGMGLNIPKEVLQKAFNSSYSASRAALMDAWRTFKIERLRFARRFCQVVYQEWLADAVTLGLIDAPGFFADPFTRAAWCGAQWSGDGPGALDPKKEAEAAEVRMRSGVTTLAKETVAYDGSDWEDNHRQRTEEVRRRRADGVEEPPAINGTSAVNTADPEEDPSID